jgi:hypothetical protein
VIKAVAESTFGALFGLPAEIIQRASVPVAALAADNSSSREVTT